MRDAIRSAWPRLLTKTSVVRDARTRSSTRGTTAGQIDPATSLRSGTGERIAVSVCFTSPQSTIRHAREPARNFEISVSGRWVADSPMR